MFNNALDVINSNNLAKERSLSSSLNSSYTQNLFLRLSSPGGESLLTFCASLSLYTSFYFFIAQINGAFWHNVMGIMFF